MSVSAVSLTSRFFLIISFSFSVRWPVLTKRSYDEAQIVDLGLQRLQHAVQQPGPFWVGVGMIATAFCPYSHSLPFLASGLHRPHWPWRVPQSFVDAMPSLANTTLPEHPLPPVDVPFVALNFGTELIDPAWGCYNCTIPDDRVRQYRRHYYASVGVAVRTHSGELRGLQAGAGLGRAGGLGAGQRHHCGVPQRPRVELPWVPH